MVEARQDLLQLRPQLRSEVGVHLLREDTEVNVGGVCVCEVCELECVSMLQIIRGKD